MSYFEAGYEPVATAFASIQDRWPAGGASCAAYVAGRKVVDLWGGEARPGRAWQRDTVCISMSTTKVVTALAMAILADHGELDVRAPVAHYWPEFAAAGKSDITVAGVLEHRSGLPWVDGYRGITDQDDPGLWDRADELADRIAAAAPVVRPGDFVYHVSTFGLLCAELCHRITGLSLRDLVEEQICTPLGIDFHLGLASTDHDRAADLVPDPFFDTEPAREELGPDTVVGQCLLMGTRSLGEIIRDIWNTPTYRSSQNAAYGAHTTAASLARLTGALALGGELDGVRLIGGSRLRRHSRSRVAGIDGCWGTPARVGLGFALGADGGLQFGPTGTSFGHYGIGGATTFADPVRGVGFAYVPSLLLDRAGLRAEELIGALYACLDATQPTTNGLT